MSTARTLITKHLIRLFPAAQGRNWRVTQRWGELRRAALERAFPGARVRLVSYRDARGWDWGLCWLVDCPIRHTFPRPAWRVVRTAFHGGGEISAHYTEEAAERAAARWRISDCTCGCCGVVAPRTRLRSLDENNSIYHDPHALVE